MAGQLYAKLRLTADGKGFVGEIRRADKALGDMSRQELCHDRCRELVILFSE